MSSHRELSDPVLMARLSSLGGIASVRDLAGGRGRTFAVDHARGVDHARAVDHARGVEHARTVEHAVDHLAAEPSPGERTVVHLRPAGPAALEREACATRLAHEAGVGAEVLGVVAESGALLTGWVPGEVLTQADLADPATLRAVGAAIARLHAVEPTHGLPVLDPLAARRGYLDRAARRGVELPAGLAHQRGRIDRLADQLAATAPTIPSVLCHGDLVPANLVRSADGTAVTMLDYEYAGVAEAAFDLGGLAATAELGHSAIAVLVAAYQQRVGGRGSAVSVSRVTAWRDVLREAWVVWVALDEDLGIEGAERNRWRSWARLGPGAGEGAPPGG